MTTPASSYKLNFSDLKNETGLLPDDWHTYGRGYRPAQQWQDIFGSDGQGPAYRLLTIAGTTGAFSNSAYLEDLQADEWLVTPPIHIENDEEILMMTVGAYGALKINDYYVFISDKGPAKEDFTQAPVIVSNLFGDDSVVWTKKSSTALRGYAGKDIWIAFVNRSKDTALLGLTDIEIAPYIMNVVDDTPMVMPEGGTFQVTVIANTYTPYETRGMKAHLTTSTGIDCTLNVDKTILPTGAQMNITFPEEILMDRESIEYTVTLTPALDEAEPTVVTGVVTQPTTSYDPVAVVEEFTGAWCTNCPRGTAFMNYYHDKYRGGETGKVIGIALHYNDPMQIEDGSYLAAAQAASGSSGYPDAYFSRRVHDDPSSKQVVTDLLSEKFYSSIQIDEVVFDPEQSFSMDVKCTVENAYPKKSLDQRLALVIVENNVTGNDIGYNQTNYFSAVPKAVVESTYGEELWPYFEFFANSPSPVPYTLMSYDHVARAIYPDYAGTLLTAECQAEEPVQFKLSMQAPDNVNDFGNISMIALLIDNRSGRILYADEMPASNFVKSPDAGVQTSDIVDGVEISSSNGVIRVNAGQPARIEVYGTDGRLWRSCSSDGAEIEIPVESARGIAIVRVSTEKGNCVRKITL